VTRWLCNLGWHKPDRRGAMEGRTDTFELTPSSSRTLSYLRCSRCGQWYPGSVLRRTWERFP
jgi:hypothetical protein